MLSQRELLFTGGAVTLFLAVKFFAVNMRWAVARARAGLRAPEDPNNTKPKPHHTAAEARTRMVVHNDMENLPLGLIAMWAAIVCVLAMPATGAGQANLAWWTRTWSLTFGVARALHTVIYSAGILFQCRRVVFATGLISTWALAIVAMQAASRATDAKMLD